MKKEFLLYLWFKLKDNSQWVYFKKYHDNSIIEVDFDGVITFTPSWADEFITKLVDRFGDRVFLIKSENPSVVATLSLLKRLG